MEEAAVGRVAARGPGLDRGLDPTRAPTLVASRHDAPPPLSHCLSQTRPNGAPRSPISQITNARGLAGFAGKNGVCRPTGVSPHTREVAGSNPAAPTCRP